MLAVWTTVAWRTQTVSIPPVATAPVQAAALEGAVRSPAPLQTELLTARACLARRALAGAGSRVATPRAVTVTMFSAAGTEPVGRARLLTAGSVPPRAAGTGSMLRVAGGSISTEAGVVTVAAVAGHGAVPARPS